MSPRPEVSVVMSVYNGAHNLPRTVDSVLCQEGCELELVVVNDGSRDRTGEILDAYAAKDSRVRVIHQENTGLTMALIRGCEAATGEFIARQDANDISMPGRLRQQAGFLRANPDVVAVSGATRFLAPGGEWLFDVRPPEQVHIELELAKLKTPSLVATSFRRDAYLRIGGFRRTFVVAQDTDLWLRLVEAGPCRGLPDIHYQATMTPGGITSRRRDEQLRLATLAIKCALRRRAGHDDAALLAALEQPHAGKKRKPRPQDRAKFHYFIASCLREHDRDAARRYYRQALRDNPFHLKALVRSVLG